jgi:uncharacterized protein YkwD
MSRWLSLLAVLGALSLPACGVGGVDAIDKALGNGGGSGNPPPAATMSQQERAYALQVLDLVNQERQTRGIEPVAWNEAAASAAYDHATDMDVRGFFDHDNPDGDGPGQRLAAVGIAGTAWAENIAQGQGSPETVMAAWMNSPGHRTNILGTGYRSLGIGVHLGVDGPWWVQDFVGR